MSPGPCKPREARGLAEARPCLPSLGWAGENAELPHGAGAVQNPVSNLILRVAFLFPKGKKGS